MVCKKCKTKNKKDAKICKNCGKRLLINYTPLVFIIISLVGVFLLFLSFRNRDNIPITPIGKNEENNNNNDIIKNSIKPIAESVSTNIQTLKDNTLTILKDCNEYYKNYKDYTTFVPFDGFLYDFVWGKFVTLEYFYKENDLANEKAVIYYLKKEDVKKFIDGETDDSFVICIVYQTDKGYILGAFDKVVEIDKESFNNLTEKYKTSSGNVSGYIQLKSDPKGIEITKKIISTIKSHNNNKKDIDIRLLSLDEKYAHIIFSTIDDSNNIKQCILENKTNKWSVILSDIEKQIRPAKYISENIVDFNYNMLPDYTIYEFRDSLMLDNSSLLEAIKTEKYVEESDVLTFFSGTNSYFYCEYKSGVRLVGNVTRDRMWIVYPVQGYDDAVILLLSISEDAPLFILKQPL